MTKFGRIEEVFLSSLLEGDYKDWWRAYRAFAEMRVKNKRLQALKLLKLSRSYKDHPNNVRYNIKKEIT